MGKKFQKKVSVIVKTFLRDDYLYLCVNSLIKNYPDFKIIVVDDGYQNEEKTAFYEKIEKENGAEVIISELFDIGLPRGRNVAMQYVKTPYVLIGDDDFLYTKEANLYKMLEFLEKNKDFDLISGAVLENDKIRHYEGFFDLSEGHYKFNRFDTETADWKKSNGIRYYQVDLAFNFFIARAEKVNQVLWDEQIKVAYEHADFFIGMKKKGFRVAYTPNCIVEHKPELRKINKKEFKEYPLYRNRKTDRKRFFEKHKLNAITDMQGKTDYYVEEQFDSNIDFIIKTCYRRESLEKLLFSIVKYYKNARIFIADDEYKFDALYYKDLWNRLFEKGLTIKPIAFNCPVDAGLSYCRNFLIDNTKGKYVFLLDDDFIFTEDTQVEKLKTILDDNQELGVVGGMLLNEAGNEIHFEGNIEKIGDDIIYSYDPKYWQETNGIKWRQTGCILNFALFRREMFLDVRWDNDIKISGEHTDFYLKANATKWKIGYCPEVKALHIQDLSSQDYKEKRARKEFLKLFFRKYNAKRLIYHDGLVYEYDKIEDKIKTYRQKV